MNASWYASVAHDLRQFVYSLSLSLDSLAKASLAAGDQAAHRAVEVMRGSCQTMDRLLSDTLDLTRMEAHGMRASLSPTEVEPLVRQLVSQYSASAESAGVRIVVLVRQDRFVVADDLMLFRVLSNLLDNAIEFSSPGSTVLIALRHGATAWRLQVRDAGMGVPEDQQSRIFDEYVQLRTDTHRPRGGTGLGLAIAKRFVALMHGTIEVRSAPDLGCSMTVRLPRATL